MSLNPRLFAFVYVCMYDDRKNLNIGENKLLPYFWFVNNIYLFEVAFILLTRHNESKYRRKQIVMIVFS